MSRIKKADSVEPILCDGCGKVHVYLLDEKGKPFAFFSLSEDEWTPFAEDCIRISRGEDPVGQPQRTMQ